MIVETIRELYAYNAWANQKILTHAVLVAPTDFLIDVPGVSFGSLRSTLAHTMLVQKNWLLRWQGQPIVEWPELTTYPDFPTIQSLWAEIEANTQTFVAAVTEAQLEGMVEYISRAGQHYSYKLRHLMLHQVNHATQHRSEAAVILTALGQSPGNWDFSYFLDEQVRYTKSSLTKI